MLSSLGALVERLTGGLMHRRAPGENLPASHDDIGIGGAELDPVADAAGHFGRDQTRAGAQKWVVDCLAGPAVVDDRLTHAFDRLLGGVPPALRVLSVTKRLLLGNSQTVVWVRSPPQWLLLPSRTAYQQVSCFQ